MKQTKSRICPVTNKMVTWRRGVTETIMKKTFFDGCSSESGCVDPETGKLPVDCPAPYEPERKADSTT
jgi:hypothetical protein